ncbi:SsrA-binding protein SmpB [Planctomycetota bacterium]|nr:SsrA-binding protein SmpB [Planctomycetota bacterium]
MSKKSKPEKSEDGRKIVASNRRAYHDYHVLERFEAGLKLAGSEVKSLRAGHCVISDAHAYVDKRKNLAWLANLQIPEWNRGNQINVYEPKRKRALLMHRREIEKIRRQMGEQGLTIIPLSIYFIRGWAKVELGLCKGKKLYDKRQDLKEKQAKREIARRMKG